MNKYLQCGDLHQGFVRIRCPDCHHKYLFALAYSSYCTSNVLCVNFRFLSLCFWGWWFIHTVSHIA
ncbi:MAG: hypothetical protein GY702_07610 [Desulfobulbaceae bacterium]|nr:hypothetical protein [Desulfobulbaceae bacterium]